HCSQEIIEAIVDALASACPERAMAGWGKRFRIAIKGEDPRNGKPFIWHMFHARPGAGASSGGDGWHGSGEWHSAGGLKFGSVEVAETRFPLFFEHHEYRSGSGGDGKFVGGAGCELLMHLETQAPAVVNTAGEGTRHAGAGREGGVDGATHTYRVLNPDGSNRALKTKEEGIPVSAGVVFDVRSGGGGGWGAPEERLKSSRDEDTRQGLEPLRRAASGNN
ncbi:MAG: hydantoinase B/oxoprolinase family protein, partial [Pseudomonadota bacterium]|nr:hydantoinase B/oxoprolinase family protein [Pseudomonadota bacterium]